jgi:hypothetical protein
MTSTFTYISHSPFTSSFDQIVLKDERTFKRIFLAWILCCNLKNCGVNFLLCESNCCFGMVLWKKTTAFIFVLLELSSRPSRRRKGCFKYFLGLNRYTWSQELRRKVYIDWMDTSLLLLCSFFFSPKHCQNLTSNVLRYTANDPALLVLSI